MAHCHKTKVGKLSNIWYRPFPQIQRPERDGCALSDALWIAPCVTNKPFPQIQRPERDGRALSDALWIALCVTNKLGPVQNKRDKYSSFLSFSVTPCEHQTAMERAFTPQKFANSTYYLWFPTQVGVPGTPLLTVSEFSAKLICSWQLWL